MSNSILPQTGNFMASGGIMGSRIQTFDWASTPLGTPDTWSQSLKMAIHNMLCAKYPTFICWGQEALITFHNDAYLSTLNESRVPMLGQSARLIWSEDWEQLSPVIDKVFGGQQLLEPSLPLFFNKKDFSRPTYPTCSFSPLFDDNGTIGGILFTSYEPEHPGITLQKPTENSKQSSESEKQLRLIADSMPALIAYVDTDHCYRFVNKTYTEWFGIQTEDIINKHISEVIGEKAYATLLPAIERALSGEKFTLEQLIPYKGRGERFVHIHYIPDIDPASQKVKGYCGLIQDITDRNQVAENLRKSEERYRAFVSQSSEAIWRFELEKPLPITLSPDELIEQCYQYGYLAECNDVMAKMYGFDKADEIIGARLGDFVPKSDPANITYLRAFITSDYRLTEAESNEIDRNGEPRHFLNNLIGIVEDGFFLRAWGTQRDITTSKASADALRESEEKFAKAFNSSPLVFTITALKTGKLVEVNETFINVTGYTREEAVGKTTHELKLWDEAQDREMELAMVTRNGLIRDVEYKFRTKTDKIITGLLSAELLEIGGEPCALTVIQDITQHARAEEALRNSENQLRLITDALPALISYIDADYRYCFVNRTYQEWFDTERTQIIGKHMREILGEAAYQAILPNIEKVMSGQEVKKEQLLHYKNAGLKYVSINYIPAIQANGVVTGFYVLVQDITERKQTEDALARERERLAIALRTGQLGVYEWRINEDSIWWSPEIFPVYGVDPASFIPTVEAFNALIHPDDREELWRKSEESIARREVFLHEYRIIKPNGAVRWISNHSQVRLDATGGVEGISGVAFDITEQKQAEQALRESEERLRRAARFAKIVVWEWNVPTNQITTTENFAEVYGLSFIEQDKQGYALVHPEDQARHTTTVQRVAQEGGSYISEFRIIRPDTQDIGWIEERATAILDDAGKVVQIVGASMDITERKAAEATHRTREERYHTLFNSIDQGFCVCEMLFDESGVPYDYRFLEANPTYVKLTGIDNPVGKTGRELVPDLEEKWFETYGKVVLTGESIRFESHLAAWDKWYDLYVSRIGKSEERKFAIIFSDITERKQAEQKIRNSEIHFRNLADSMPQVVWIANTTGTVYYYNKQVRELSGIVESKPNHWEWSPSLHPDDVKPTILAWQKAVQEKSIYTYEHRLQMKDGSYRWHLSRAFPILDETGNLLRWYGTATDIDDLKQTQQALIESEQHFRKMADAAPVLIWQAGLDKAYYYFNKGWLAFTGRTLEQEVGNGWAEGIHPDDLERCLDIYTTHFDLRESFMMEYRLLRHDGEYRWLLDHGVPTYDHNGVFTGFIGTCVDIHEKKTAEEQKDAFLYIAGHELRTPLTSLLGFINLLLNHPDNSDFAKTYLRKCFASALKMRGLIADFLYFSRSNPGQLPFEVSEFDFDTLIQETVENIQLSYPHYQIDLQGNTKTVMQGDRGRIEQVVNNLLNNAVKYSPGKTRIDVLTRQEKDKIILKVKDYGIGIESEDIPRLFDRFRRASNVGKIKGMGLGLYIAKEIVDYYKGAIFVESTPGEGSTFTVELPIPLL